MSVIEQSMKCDNDAERSVRRIFTNSNYSTDTGMIIIVCFFSPLPPFPIKTPETHFQQ